MKQIYTQYPQAYSRDHSRYTFFCDDGTQVTLVSGQDGVTEEWIATLKDAHKQESNLMRRGRSKAEGQNKVISLTQVEEEFGEACDWLIDPSADVEERFFADFEAGERRKQIEEVLAVLNAEQRELLIKVRLQGASITAIAEECGVARQAIQNRISKIEKKIFEIRAKGGCV